jgi:transcriptional regulator with XRE-family HTH domain
VDNRDDVRQFLSSRRAQLTPERAGLAVMSRNRRVLGLRREEVAMLAGVSVDYYTRLERGNLRGASDSVLEALARALQLEDAERAHLFDLARAAASTADGQRRAAPEVRPSLQRLIDAMAGVPAFITNACRDVVAANQLARALYCDMYVDPVRPANLLRFIFLEPRARRFFVDWQRSATFSVAILRTEAGRHPGDRAVTDLVRELSSRSEDFRTRWAAHQVAYHHTGTKAFRHPVVGELTLSFDTMDLPADAGLTLFAYTTEPGSHSAAALNRLARWATGLDGDLEAAGQTSGSA